MVATENDLLAKIAELKRKKNAVILAHNYQVPEVQETADFVGDSLELSMKAMDVKAKFIVFAGVDFMAEQAAVLNPSSTVLIPDLGARCHMANMLPRELVVEAKKKHPRTPVLLYVNTLAEAKAEADYLCTSANAVEVAESIPSDTIIFGPDANLARYVEEKTGKNLIVVPPYGHCYVHTSFSPEDIREAKKRLPNAKALVHPECPMEVLKEADFVGSTSQMLRAAKSLEGENFIVATEVGLLHRLRKENPGKKFWPAYDQAICVYMKRITLEKVYESLLNEKYVVAVPEEIAARVRRALNNTFKLLGVERSV
mgnify:CR=1 FL=1